MAEKNVRTIVIRKAPEDVKLGEQLSHRLPLSIR